MRKYFEVRTNSSVLEFPNHWLASKKCIYCSNNGELHHIRRDSSSKNNSRNVKL